MESNQPSSSSSSSVLQEISEVLAKITPGEWIAMTGTKWYRIKARQPNGEWWYVMEPNRWAIHHKADAEFIAATPRLLRHAQAEIEGLQQKVQALEIEIESGEPENRRRMMAEFMERATAAEARAEAAEGRLRELQEPDVSDGEIRRRLKAHIKAKREGTTPPTAERCKAHGKIGCGGCLLDSLIPTSTPERER